MSALSVVPIDYSLMGEATPAIQRAPLRRLALRPAEAADALGVSLDTFTKHIAPNLRTVRVGRISIVSVVELERWLENGACDAEGGRSC